MTAPAMDGVGSTKAMCEADSQKALAADADVSMATVTADLLRPDNMWQLARRLVSLDRDITITVSYRDAVKGTS